MKVRDKNERRWGTKQVLYAYDIALIVEPTEDLQYIINEFKCACDRYELKINEELSKVLMITKKWEIDNEKRKVNEEKWKRWKDLNI